MEHLKVLSRYLKVHLVDECVEVLTGSTPKRKRDEILERARAGEIHFLLSTYALAKEGLDIPRLDRLHLVTPQKDYAVVVQAVGRVARRFPDKEEAVVYDYVDSTRWHERAWKTRCRHYKQALFASNSDEWSTPDKLFQELDQEFHFTLDPCCTPENAKCNTYFTRETDGLSHSWEGHIVFCNPPYSNIKEWVRKCYREGQQPGTIVVMLIPSRTDTRYFHDYIIHRSEIRFVKGRLKFGDGKNSAPFPSMVVVFYGEGM